MCVVIMKKSCVNDVDVLGSLRADVCALTHIHLLLLHSANISCPLKPCSCYQQCECIFGTLLNKLLFMYYELNEKVKRR